MAGMAAFAAIRSDRQNPDAAARRRKSLAAQVSDILWRPGSQIAAGDTFDPGLVEHDPWLMRFTRNWYILLGFPEPKLSVDLELVRMYLYYEDLYHGRPYFSEKYWFPPFRGCTLPKCVSFVGDCFILASILSVLTQTHPDVAPLLKPMHWFVIDGVIVMYFLLEYSLRLFVCNVFGGSRLSFLVQPLNVCDFMAIVPYFASLFGGSKHLEVLKIFRMARLLRLLMSMKIGRLLLATFRVSATALYILVIWILISGVLLGALVYSFERLSCYEPDDRPSFLNFITEQSQLSSTTPRGDILCEGSLSFLSPSCKIHCAYECDETTYNDRAFIEYCYYKVKKEDQESSEIGPDGFYGVPVHTLNFPSIRASLWYTVVTKATVGFGDIYPETVIGKSVCGMLCMLSGILAISLPVAVLGNTFQDLAGLQGARDSQGKLMEGESISLFV
eukprot:g17210.t1